MGKVIHKNYHLHDGLTGYWPMNGNSNDLIGGNNGVDTDITYVAGISGQAASFNGGSSEINILPISIPDGGNATISVWFKVNSFPLVLFTGTPSQQPYIGAVNASQAYFSTDSGGSSVRFYSFTFLTGVWYNLVYTFSNNTVRVFCNGVESVSGPQTTGGNFVINKFGGYNSGYDINGIVDKVKLWNRALSDYEIKRIYNGGKGLSLVNGVISLSNGLISRWRFDGNVNDDTTSFNGSASNITYTAGKIGQAAVFDGNLPSSVVVGQPVQAAAGTISFWYYPTSFAATQCIFGNAAGDLMIRIVGVNSILVSYFDISYKLLYTVYTINTWQLLTLTWDSSFVKIYNNSTLIVTVAAGALSSVANNFAFGTQGATGTNPYYGRIDDGRLYNRALTINEIRKLYNNGYGFIS